MSKFRLISVETFTREVADDLADKCLALFSSCNTEVYNLNFPYEISAMTRFVVIITIGFEDYKTLIMNGYYCTIACKRFYLGDYTYDR